MHYLLLSILSSTAIAVIFKIQDRLKIKLFPVIVINYFTATLLGYSLSITDQSLKEIIQSDWIISGILIGLLLIAGFWLIGYSTQKVGIAITTVSNKMSVVIPILFSMFFFDESRNIIKFIGISVALLAIILSIFKKKKDKTDLKFLWLPILLFLVIGIIDSLIKYSQTNLNDDTLPVFTMITFGIAGISGVIGSFINSTTIRDFADLKTLITGILLGTANYGSMYFLILSLEKTGLDSSVIFGINNVGIISLSILTAFFVFKEKLRLINWAGIILSIIAILILSNILL